MTFKQDPLEELQEVYEEVRLTEQNFKKALDVCSFMVEKNKELFSDYEVLEKEYQKLSQKNQKKEDQNAILIEENGRITQQLQFANAHNKEMEQVVRNLQDEIEEKT